MKVAVLALCLALSGCAATLPALGGRTHYNVEFSDVTAEQNTSYKMNIKAPAGVDIASVAGMNYQWSPDGTGQIAVSNNNAVNTQSQADAIVEVNRQDLEAIAKGLTALLGQAPK